MPSREEMIAFLESKSQKDSAPKSQPSREEMISFLNQKQEQPESAPPDGRPWYEKAAEAVDSVTGAPTRAALDAAIDFKNPLTAFKKQFGEGTSTAPTGKQIAEKLGVSGETKVLRTAEEQQKFDEQFNPGWAQAMKQSKAEYKPVTSTPSEAAGLAIELGADWTNLAGLGLVKKSAEAAKKLPLIEKFGAKSATTAKQTQSAAAAAEGTSKAVANISGGDLAVEQSGKMFDYQAPKNLKELDAWKPQAGQGEMLGKKRLMEIEGIVPDLQTKPMKYHYSMMENPKSMKELKLQFENLPTESAKKIAAYNYEIVGESGRKIQQTVSDIAGYEPKSLTDAGHDLIATVKDKYKAEKEMLKPAFEELKSSPRLSRAETMDLAQAIGQNSEIGKLMSTNEEGRLFLQKNTPRSGISDAEHSVLSRVVEDMNDGMTFTEIQKTRDFLRKQIDPMNPSATSEIAKVRSVMLGQLEAMAEKKSASVAETFKGYAINEKGREAFEEIIGGKIESFDAMYSANPDKVLQKVFSNPNYSKIVGNYVGPEKMKEMIASYIQHGISKSTDSAKGFSPTDFKRWMKTNANFLNHNVEREVIDRMSALADYGYYGKRFLDEVNPSGTAASIKEMVKPETFVQSVRQKGILGAIQSEVAGKIEASTKQRQAVRATNEAMGTTEQSLTSRIRNNLPKVPTPSGAKVNAYSKANTMGREMMRDVTPIQSAQSEKEKGPEKWAKDGLKKLKAHDSSLSSDLLNELLKTKKGKNLLIKASDLKPGSRAMDKIMEEIRSSNSNGGE